jgi:peptide deformylase
LKKKKIKHKMIFPIYVYGTSVLRKRAKEIGTDYPELPQLIADMFDTMKISDGVGLAAPQIGLSIRLIVIDTSEIEDVNDPSLKDFRKILINPVILEENGIKWLFNEGCLSLPEIREDVERNEKIRLRYYDENFIMHEEEYDGVKARVIQHEHDHLEGVLFVDRINPIRKRLLNKRLKAISKGNVSTNYKIITGN